MRFSAQSVPTARELRPALAAAALATLLNPLNTSMIAVALVDVQRSFAVEIHAATWLLSSFALTSAIAQPLMGRLADRFGPRRVLLAGMCAVGASGFAAMWAASFGFLVTLRVLQALGTSTGYPAGMALLRRMQAGTSARGGTPPAWLGLISASGNASAAIGPVLGGALVELWSWRAVLLVNVPLALFGAFVLLRWLPPDTESAPRQRVAFTDLRAVRDRSLLKVYAQMAALCVVFYSIFFGLPLWLEHSRGLTAAGTGLMLVPLAALSALATPLAVKTTVKLGSAWVLLIGSAALVAGTVPLLAMDEDSSMLMLGVLIAIFGVTNAFSNLGLQADLTASARAGDLGAAGGFLQTARFVGAGLAASLIGSIFAQGATTAALHRLAVTLGVLSLVLLSVTARRLVRQTSNRRRRNRQEVQQPETVGNAGEKP